MKGSDANHYPRVFQTAETGNEPRTLAGKVAVLTTALGPPPPVVSMWCNITNDLKEMTKTATIKLRFLFINEVHYCIIFSNVVACSIEQI